MSELQFSLLIIGILVVLAVYGYGVWQQRRYRINHGDSFAGGEREALYHGVLARKRAGEVQVDPDDGELEHFLGEDDIPYTPNESACANLGERTDFIGVMFADTPLYADSLTLVWVRRADFGKNLHVCGVPAGTREWETVTPDSTGGYDTFRIALQLADRSGAVNEARLSEFCELLRDTAEVVQAEINLPIVAEAVEEAQRLDAFCAEVDQVISLNIIPDGDALLTGSQVALAAADLGLVLHEDGLFHFSDEQDAQLFTLANFDGMPFQEVDLEDAPVIGLSLQMDVPCVAMPARKLDNLLGLARELGGALHANVVDDDRQPLGEAGISKIRTYVSALEKRMHSQSIPPGSPLARRLFS